MSYKFPGRPLFKSPGPSCSMPAGIYAAGYFGSVSNWAQSFYSGGQNANFLYDVTSGSTGSCNGYLCQAGPGFDGPTGKGSPHIGFSERCQGGGSCTSPNSCARYGSSDICCPSSFPVWCGGGYCYQPGYQCPAGSVTLTCVGGGTCSSPNVCARWSNQDVCCPASYPVWCGAGSCYQSGYACPFALDSELPAAMPVALASSARPTILAGAAHAIPLGNASSLL